MSIYNVDNYGRISVTTEQLGYGGRTSIEIPKPFKNFKPRDIRWLWWALKLKGGLLPDEAIVPQSERLQCIAEEIRHFNSPEQMIDDLARMHDDDLVPEQELQWLSKDGRVQLWMLNEMQGEIRGSREMPQGLTIFEELTFRLDTWNASKESKQEYLKKKKRCWANDRTPDSDTKWLNLKDETQLRWAWEYLRKQRQSLRFSEPISLAELHDAILASIDTIRHSSDKELLINKIRKNWSQQKYRNSEGARKQQYMPLNKKASDHLKKLAESTGMKPHELVEQLIEAKWEQQQASRG